jgi:pyruvate dehydrogenase (quinone)
MRGAAKKTTIADQFLNVLREAGVVRDSLSQIVDAVRRTDGIEWVSVRNEKAGASAAAVEAQLPGRLAVWAASCGRLTRGGQGVSVLEGE